MFYTILLFIIVSVNCECPVKWSQFKDSCYWASTYKAYGWQRAQEECKEKSSFLAEIGDMDENDFIARMTFGSGTWFFMGIVYSEQDEGWVTASNDEEIDYSNWNEDESNMVETSSCVKMAYRGFWETFPCDEPQYFICESENYISTSPFNYVGQTNSFYFNGHHYRTIGKKATFEKAQALCKKAGAYLVEPNTEEENEYVHDKMHEAFYGYWRFIGGSDRIREGYWVWGNRNKTLTFTNWWPGEPNNKYNEDCMEMRYWGKWNDVSCYTGNRFICERPVDYVPTTMEPTTKRKVQSTEATTTEDYYYY